MHRIITLRTITPLHIGTGQAVGTTDLPIAREKATRWPVVPGSSVKGVLKDAARIAWMEQSSRDKRSHDDGEAADKALAHLFGAPKGETASAGALSVTDMRTLLFPVRSLAGTFAYTTSLLAIARANEFLRVARRPEIPIPVGLKSPIGLPAGSVLRFNGKTYLEDLDLESTDLATDPSAAISKLIGMPEIDVRKRLAIIEDGLFTYLTETATEVTTHVTLEFETRTAKGGFLRSEERIPPEAVFIGLIAVDLLHHGGKSADALDHLARLNDRCYLQFGGKASVGNGICRLHIAEAA